MQIHRQKQIIYRKGMRKEKYIQTDYVRCFPEKLVVMFEFRSKIDEKKQQEKEN